MSESISGNLACPQTKIDLFDEVNFELSKEELQEAVKLSGYTKTDKSELTKEVDVKKLPALKGCGCLHYLEFGRLC